MVCPVLILGQKENKGKKEGNKSSATAMNDEL
jgi:hypothetical protein